MRGRQYVRFPVCFPRLRSDVRRRRDAHVSQSHALVQAGTEVSLLDPLLRTFLAFLPEYSPGIPQSSLPAHAEDCCVLRVSVQGADHVLYEYHVSGRPRGRELSHPGSTSCGQKSHSDTGFSLGASRNAANQCRLRAFSSFVHFFPWSLITK